MNERPVEMIALLGLGVVFIILALWVRRSRTRERRRPALASPEFYAEFERDAVEIAERLMAFADAELQRKSEEIAAQRAEPIDSHRQALHDASVVRMALFALASLERASTALARKLDELRHAREDEAERIEAEWNYLATALVDRFPILGRTVHDTDLPALERMSADRSALLAEIAQRRSELGAARAVLARDRSLVWSQITLVAITITLKDAAPDEEAAAAARVHPRSAALVDAESVKSALAFAVRVFHAVPAHLRTMYDGVPVPAELDPRLAAALVRQRVSESLTGGPLEKARALSAGEPALLWLGVPVVTACEYPHRAAEALGKLVQPGRMLIKAVENGDVETARRITEELRSLAAPLLGAAGAEDVAAAARQLTLGADAPGATT